MAGKAKEEEWGDLTDNHGALEAKEKGTVQADVKNAADDAGDRDLKRDLTDDDSRASVEMRRGRLRRHADYR